VPHIAHLEPGEPPLQRGRQPVERRGHVVERRLAEALGRHVAVERDPARPPPQIRHLGVRRDHHEVRVFGRREHAFRHRVTRRNAERVVGRGFEPERRQRALELVWAGDAEAAEEHGAVLLEQEAQRLALRADQVEQREAGAPALDDGRQGRIARRESEFGGAQGANDRVFRARLRAVTNDLHRSNLGPQKLRTR
jgi:hypothetical protein